DRFEIIAEKVRAEFGYEIYREEIQGLQKEKRGIVSEARLELQSLCKEANLAEALNLDHVSNAKLDELQKSFLALASGLPRTGSLKYAYLPGPYKEKLDAFLDEIMKITDFHRLESKCLKLTDEISALYGNGAEKQAYNREKAKELLTKGMGNTVLTFLKELKQELEQSAPQEGGELLTLVRKAALPLLGEFTSYRELVAALPNERTPMKEVLSSPDVSAKFSRVDKDILNDIRVKAMVDGYIKAACQQEHRKGKDRAELTKGVYRDLHRAVREVVMEQLQKDSGYQAQMARDAVLSLLLHLFRSNSQAAGQMQSRRDLLKSRSRELSEAALRDRKKQQEQAGSWAPEL
ncbi:MAG: relaxase MobL, partial [Desulfitobacterium hafniense]